MSKIKAGISSLGLHLPSLYMSVEELAKLRQIDPVKCTVGLGCDKMALCKDRDESVVDLAVEAAKRALSRWDGDIENIGLIAIGTESAIDMSRPLSAWVADKLGLSGAIRSYEVKHACYGGTLAVRQAEEWKLSGVGGKKAALVIAADVALYSPGELSEPTQGAAAVAMIIDEPSIAEIEPLSYPWSKPAFDFWRPVGDQYPRVEGRFSMRCYQEALQECFHQFLGNKDPKKAFEQFKAMCFHTPFPKMVKNAFLSMTKSYGWSAEESEAVFKKQIFPFMEWNLLSGNSYTASLWTGVARALCGLSQGDKLSAFSYGSGYGAELLMLKAGPLAKEAAWAKDIEIDLKERKEIHAEDYEKLRNHEKHEVSH
jgi:hydroxymethylglutaryl-CoA synthase